MNLLGNSPSATLTVHAMVPTLCGIQTVREPHPLRPIPFVTHRVISFPRAIFNNVKGGYPYIFRNWRLSEYLMVFT